MSTKACSFEEWLASYFDHPVPKSLNDFGRNATRLCKTTPVTETEYVIRAFEDPHTALWRFSDDQLGGGLWMMLSGGRADNWQYPFHFEHESISWPLKERAIRSIYTLYERLFAVRCSNKLAHLNETSAWLDTACYMWWDIFPTYRRIATVVRERLNDELVDVMARALRLNSVACQESALHGLGEWQINYPERTQPLIDDFLKQKTLRPELRRYALSARSGLIQ